MSINPNTINMNLTSKLRIGIDLGGTKISAIVLSPDGKVLKHIRRSSPHGDYHQTISVISQIICRLEQDIEQEATIGIGIPGSISPITGNIQNSNSTWLNGKPFGDDLEEKLSRQIKFANDANCFALSEARDGAGANYKSVFGVIIGTGCGGGLVIDKKIIDGPRGIGGEWGHNPLPWAHQTEVPGPKCWCGRNGCMERWVSGPALSADHYKNTNHDMSAIEIEKLAIGGDLSAKATLNRYASRLARGLASIINVFDADIIVLGGGLSKMEYLYKTLPKLMAPYIFCDHNNINISPPKFGDDSGVRGAAFLWDE